MDPGPTPALKFDAPEEGYRFPAIHVRFFAEDLDRALEAAEPPGR
jgi:hypothetical protein